MMAHGYTAKRRYKVTGVGQNRLGVSEHCILWWKRTGGSCNSMIMAWYLQPCLGNPKVTQTKYFKWICKSQKAFLAFSAIRVLKYNYYIQLNRTVKQKCLLLVTFQGAVKIALWPLVMRVDSSVTIHNKVSLVLCPENNLLYPYGSIL